MPFGLGFLLALLVVFSCTSGARLSSDTPTPRLRELAPSDLAQAQRNSLRFVFYRNNEAPPPPTPTELRRLERDLATAPPVEVQELRDLYGDDLELLAYATRDSDNDGIFDYRISEYRGKFFEGDLDIDGDGIRNVYDVAPYDPKVGGVDTTGDGIPDKPGSFADRDGDGIPDHLDWSRRKPEALAELQANLFHDFGVILVERSSRFTPDLVQAVDDTLRLVFRRRIPTLRTITVEDQLLISPDLGDNGFMLGQTQTLTICTKTLEGAAPIVLLGLVVHEVAHAWQLAQDFDESNLAAENVKMHFAPGRFTRSLERFGWDVDGGTLEEGYHHRIYWPHFYATSPRYLYRGSSPREWATWFEDVQRESGPEFLRNSPAMTWGMVGPYSLTSPWEWHADHLMSALYNRIDRGVSHHKNRTYRNIAGLLRGVMLDAVQSQWSRYDYRNAVGTSIDRELGRRFGLTEEQIAMLVDRYVIPLADFPMLSHALALDTAGQQGFGAVITFFTPGSGLISGTWRQTWTGFREQMQDPLRNRPDLHSLVQIGFSPWDDDPRGSLEPARDLVEGVVDEGADAPAKDRNRSELLTDDEHEAQANPDRELLGTLGEPLPQRDRTRSGRDRGGAGRVGGYSREDRTYGAADVEDESADVLDSRSADDRTGVHRIADPVTSLLDQLRQLVPSDPDLELDPDFDDEISE